MPFYTFELLNGSAPVSDETGIDVPDREHAASYGCEVARELMRGREFETRSWRLDVYDDLARCVAEIPFAALDPTLDHLAPELRSMVERMCDNRRSLQEAIHAARATIRESRALLALARGKPYLAAVNGDLTIR